MKRTPLYDSHIKLKAKMIDFAGWDMPVYYSGLPAGKAGIIFEHKAVRSSAGIFDIGHMGAIKVSGPNALPYLQRVLTNDASKLEPGSSQYSLILNNSGGVLDDIFVYRLPDYYMLVLNASNTEKDINWLKKNNSEKAEITDLKDKMTFLALQGPKSQEILQKVCDIDLKVIGHHKIVSSLISHLPSLISRTGYTGEDGFELFFDRANAELIWGKLVELGAVPCGLGARDSLRLEAGMPLYGHEYNEGITPLETPFKFAVKMEKGDFIGKAGLLHHQEAGISKKLVGIKLIDKGIPRQGYKVFEDGKAVGYFTSGTLSPTLNKPIGMAFIRGQYSEMGTRLNVEIRGKLFNAEVVKLPFYIPATKR